MNKLKRVFIFTPVIFILLLSSTTFAQASAGNPYGANDKHKHGGKSDFIKMLNLTKEQQEQIQKQREADSQKWMELKDKLKAKRLELQQELEKPAIDKGKVKNLVGEINALTGEQFSRKVDNLISMKQSLTPEQFKKMMERKHRD